MKYFSNNLRFVVVLSAILAVFLTNWIVENETTELDRESLHFDHNVANIKSIDAQFANKKLYLNVHLNQDTSCKEIMNSLAIQPLIVKGKIYTPSCHRIDISLIKIVYVEVVEA